MGSHGVIPTELKTNLVLRHEQTYISLRIQVCPKKGSSPTILLWGWDWDHRSYSIGGVWILSARKRKRLQLAWFVWFFSQFQLFELEVKLISNGFGNHHHVSEITLTLGLFRVAYFVISGCPKKREKKVWLKVNNQSDRTEERWLTCSKNPAFFTPLSGLKGPFFWRVS